MVAAGGRGDRAPGETPKQFRALGGKPLLSWSLEVLAEAGCAPIVIAAPPDLLAAARECFEPGLQAQVVSGGVTRQASVAIALKQVTHSRVVVHDGARPFIDADIVRRVLAALERAQGAVSAVPVDETVKRVHDHLVAETVDRATLWRAQTPQAFHTADLRRAHEKAAAEGFVGTDDAQLIERYGGRVAVVRGSRRNVKLTYADDFKVAEALIARGRSQG